MGTNKNSAVWPPFAFHWTRFIGATRWLVWWCREGEKKKKIDESGYTTARRGKKKTHPCQLETTIQTRFVVFANLFIYFLLCQLLLSPLRRGLLSSFPQQLSRHRITAASIDLAPNINKGQTNWWKTIACVHLCVFVPSFPNPFCPPPLPLLPGVLAIFQVNAIQKKKKRRGGDEDSKQTKIHKLSKQTKKIKTT